MKLNERRCKVTRCKNIYNAKGYCYYHYQKYFYFIPTKRSQVNVSLKKLKVMRKNMTFHEIGSKFGVSGEWIRRILLSNSTNK